MIIDLATLIIAVQVLAAFSLVIAIVTSIWSLLLQKREVVKQNQRIIDLLEKIQENTKNERKS